MTKDKSTPRPLQQQPQSDSDPRAGSTDLQSGSQAERGQSKGGEVEGEGSYSGSRDYKNSIKDYLDKADVKKDAEKAKPRSESEARELEQAEREGKSHSKGER